MACQDQKPCSPAPQAPTGTITTGGAAAIIIPTELHYNPPPPQKAKTTMISSSSSRSRGYELTARNIYYSRPSTATATLAKLIRSAAATPPPPTYILRDVSLTVRPREILAIVGPSGAGKSTLLDILSSRTAATAGRLLLDRQPLHPQTFRRLCSHLPQHDPLLPQLTVSESFLFHSRLRNSGAAIDDLLATLRLTHIANARLSSNLSGGERRRVSIGLSLLSDPAVLLLDEPTSGLDSSSAHSVLLALRAAAAAGPRTVVLSIHQPSFKLLSSIDSILLLRRGSVVHHGDLPSLGSSLGASGFPVPLHLNPLEFAMEVLPKLEPISAADDDPPPPETPDRLFLQKPRYPSSRYREIGTLFARSAKIVCRTKQLLLANTVESLVVGFLLGTIYINAGDGEEGGSENKRMGLFAFSLTFLLSSTTETLPIFVAEREILVREASTGVYRLSSHLVAATLVFLPYLLMVSIIYASSVYFLAGLCQTWAAFLSFVAIVWAVLATANSFVLLVSSVAPDYIAGTSLVTASLAGFFLFSGYFISKGSIPGYWVFLHYLSPYKYALDAMLENEYSCASARCFGRRRLPAAAEGRCEETGREVMESRGLRHGERWRDIAVLIGFCVAYRLLYFVILGRRASRPNK